MTRHASAEELALLDEGELRRRKAAKVTAHVAGCTQCTQVRAELVEVTAVLSASPYPQLPETVSVRIESALRVEMNTRLTAAPATEAGRRELPARNQRQRADSGQRGWHLPGLSVPVTRLVTAAGAVVLVGGGGYLVASNLTSGVTSPSSSAALPAPATQPMTQGPSVTYGSPGSQHTIHSVSSNMNFVPGQLRSQAISAYQEAQLKGEAGPAASGSENTRTLPSTGAAGPAPTGIGGCIDAVSAGRSVLLVDMAKYLGKPATIIVLGGTAKSQAEVIVTSGSCSDISHGVLARAALGHL